MTAKQPRATPEPEETFGPRPGPYDPVVENYRGNRNFAGEFVIRDPKNRARTHGRNQIAEGVDFDPHDTSGGY